MKKIILIVICVFFTLTTFSQTWHENRNNQVTHQFSKPGKVFLLIENSNEFGLNENSDNRYGADITFGFQPYPDWFIGLGSGFRIYDNINNLIIPIFVESRRYFSYQNKVYPYVGLKGGYSLSADGVFISPTVGLNFKINYRTTFHVGFGITVQKFKQDNLSVFESDPNSFAGLITIGLKL